MHTRGRRGHGGVHVSLPFVTPHLWSIVAKFGQASGRLNLLTPLRPPPALVRKGTLWPEVGFTSASFYAQLGSVLQDARLLFDRCMDHRSKLCPCPHSTHPAPALCGTHSQHRHRRPPAPHHPSPAPHRCVGPCAGCTQQYAAVHGLCAAYAGTTPTLPTAQHCHCRPHFCGLPQNHGEP